MGALRNRLAVGPYAGGHVRLAGDVPRCSCHTYHTGLSVVSLGSSGHAYECGRCRYGPCAWSFLVAGREARMESVAASGTGGTGVGCLLWCGDSPAPVDT